jgi:FkbM family methyltransferase
MGRENWAKTLGLDKDGTLFVELDSGIVIYDAGCHPSLPHPAIINPEDLMRAENRRLYFCFLTTLNEISEIIYNSAYDERHQYRKGDVVVDAGARVGVFAAKAARAVGEEGKVIAIEPEPLNFARLVKNIKANRFENVIAVQKMLWSRQQKLDLYLSGNSASHSAYCGEFYSSTGESVSVDADTLDNILDGLGNRTVNFLKMDIEGSEVEALKGMEKTLKCDMQMAIAAYHPAGDARSDSVIIPQLERHGFSVDVTEAGIIQAGKREVGAVGG